MAGVAAEFAPAWAAPAFISFSTPSMPSSFSSSPRIHDWSLCCVSFALIGLCYGGGFGTMPSYTADFFGSKSMGGIYGILLLAWGLAAIPSPIMIARVHQNLGKYAPAINVITVVMLRSLILPLLSRRPSKLPAATASTGQSV
jgi:OFA family oxalate/formate antiporter-like MFS transporter